MFDLKDVEEKITDEHLCKFDINKADFLLLKTKNSFDKEFNFEFVFLAESAANFLKEKQIKGVGIDALGIERNQPNHPSHHILLGSGIIVMEGVCLASVASGTYQMIAMPLKVLGHDALPLSAILIKQ